VSAPLRLAIFDLDGTIVDSKHNIIQAVTEVAQTMCLDCPPPEQIPRVIGLSLGEALATLFPGLDPTAHQTLDREYREAFNRMRLRPDHREPLFEGTLGALEDLERAGFLLGIATGKAQRGVDYFLKKNGFEKRFITIQTPDVAPGKPHPGMVLRAMSETGVEPVNTVMIGDTSYDIQMARAAGVGAIGVSWGNHSVTELKTAGAHHLIERLGDLLHAVEALTAPVPAR
jgi:phosphoglycolate phosphatase